MNRKLFHILCLIMWVGIIALGFITYPRLIEMAKNSQHSYAVPVLHTSTFFLALLLFLAQSRIADIIAPVQIEQRKLSDEEKKKIAEQRAAKAIKEGRVGAAMRIYEDAGMLMSALRVAQEHKDILGQARISIKLGRYDRAEKLFIQCGEFEEAARAATLTGAIEHARELYREAAIQYEQKNNKSKAADCRDRAGDYEMAGIHYEACGKPEYGSECFDLLGDKENARRLDEQSKALRAFEARRGIIPSLEEKSGAGKKNKPEDLEQMGDLLGAGFLYRETERWIEAGIVFQRYQEWERAARAFEAGGQDDRAELARMNLPEKPDVEEDEIDDSSVSGMPPAPRDAPPSHLFRPLNQMSPVPVFAGAQLPPPDLKSLEAAAKMVREGKFTEAAKYAEAANDWMMAAAFYELSGDLLSAADVYRQIGRTDEAALCLRRAQRPQQAAMMQLAAGNRERAMEALIAAIEEEVDPDAGVLLGEMLVRWGKLRMAMRLLHEKLLKGGIITKDNAEISFRFAAMLEENQCYAQALEIYQQMLDAGAHSDEIRNRVLRLENLLDNHPAAAGATVLEASSIANDEMERLLAQMLSGSDGGQRPDDEQGPSAEVQRATQIFEPFEFAVPDEIAGGMLHRGEAVSIFGVPAGFEKHSGNDPAGILAPDEIPEMQIKRAQDPFAMAQRYDVIQEIARGGMGAIYEAHDNLLDRRIALKLILEERSAELIKEQFMLEARAIARLSHPNVVMIFDIGLIDLRHYIAMELIRGGALDDYVQEKGRLTIKESMRLFIEAARGLQAAHEGGIVHRDIKPGNLLLTQRHEVKIVDFGLAKLARDEDEPGGQTMFKCAGTPGYMAPEQILGGDLLPRCDIYALGITLFYMLIGQPPNVIVDRRKQHEILEYQLKGELPQLSDIRPETPKAIEKLYHYCTIADPDERYQSISAFLPAAEKWYYSH
ncbi:protein kinase [Candidatus Sumerlaeota bacterium]|nr:protein kinase [Candidatus Sumerlaeota bacterium]